MPEWRIMSDTVTAGGLAHDFEVGWPGVWGDKFTARRHVIAAERHGGGSDSRMPRRVLGIGSDAASARLALEATIQAVDRMGTISPSR